MDMLTYVNFLKRCGFIVQSFDSYNGLSNTYDYGILGSFLKNNVKNLLIEEFVKSDPNSYLVETSLLTKEEVLKASGHVDKFEDYFVDCKSCKKRFKLDEHEEMKSCPNCGENNFTNKRNFNLLFETRIGSLEETSSKVYLRPETAQGIFANFHLFNKQIKKPLPFSICQTGKAFRNEITPSNFTYRTLEFEQFEVERFIEKSSWKKQFDIAQEKVIKTLEKVGVDKKLTTIYNQKHDELAHYSKKTTDIEFAFPFGKNELLGIAYRQSFDLEKHESVSKQNMKMNINNNQELPHVIETSIGIDRLVLSILISSYKKETVGEDERYVLKLKPRIAPITCSIFPLSSKLREKTKEVFESLNEQSIKLNIALNMDLSSTSIGKKYRRNDEIGTPCCVTVDFESLEDGKVTLRDRDTMKQVRMNLSDVVGHIFKELHK